MLKKYDHEQPIETIENALWHTTQAKNALSLHRGYSPEMLVLGKATRLPGSCIEDTQITSHMLAEHDQGQGVLFRAQLQRCELARRAFHIADNAAALRRAILRRSRPGGRPYETGEWIMMYLPRGSGSMESCWTGPFQVLSRSNSQSVWASRGNRIQQAAPEHCRPVSAMEAREVRQHVEVDELDASQSNEPAAGPVSLDENLIPMPMPMPSGPMRGEPSTEPDEVSQPDHEPSAEDLTSRGSEAGPDTRPAHEVPIPESDEDGLWAETNWLLDERTPALAWRTEVTVGDRDIHAWKGESDPTDLA